MVLQVVPVQQVIAAQQARLEVPEEPVIEDQQGRQEALVELVT